MPNIEIKASCSNLIKAKQVAESLKAHFIGKDHQVDTYFHTKKGRLKLRESSLSGCMLIPYLRGNICEPKKSEYTLFHSEQPVLAKKLLSETLGIETIVEKTRDIYIYENVRIHLDDVKGHGSFIEFEAVYQESPDKNNDDTQAQEQEKIKKLIEIFAIRKEDLIEGSYREKELKKSPARSHFQEIQH